MAIYITDACINCGACVTECPNNAIYEPSAAWTLKEGTEIRAQSLHLLSTKYKDINESQIPLSDDIYYIVTEKCTECKGFHESPQCAFVCPVDCCLPDPINPETEEVLHQKMKILHPDK